jgi:hypothetical protein
MAVSSTHDPVAHYRRLEWTAGLIARHPDFPGKSDAVGECRDDIERRFRQGILTVDERSRLLAILDGIVLPE